MKKLLIVGAGILQLPGILKAKEMGLYVGVLDYNPDAVGIQYADEYFNASTMDEDAVLKVAEEFSPDGIMTLATDMPMRGVAKAAEKLKLPGISYSTALKATDKYEMIKAFKLHNVPSPWFYAVDSKTELDSLKSYLDYPCIMKPTDNAGSHGVVKAYSFDDLLESFEYSFSNSRQGKVIIEECLLGNEVSVEVMVINGVSHVLQITDKLTTGAPNFVEMGHSQPTRQTDTDAIKEVASMACEAVGIDNGPAHVEMMVTENGPVMIELGARMGGDNITTALVPLSTGIDMVKSTIDVALGNTPAINAMFSCGSAIRYFEAPCGTIRGYSGVEEAKQLAGVKQIVFTKEVGEESLPIHCSNDRIGFVIAQADSAEKAVSVCEEAMRLIKIDIG